MKHTPDGKTSLWGMAVTAIPYHAWAQRQQPNGRLGRGQHLRDYFMKRVSIRAVSLLQDNSINSKNKWLTPMMLC